MRLDSLNGAAVDQVWAVIRVCVIRVVWLERNLRVFNGTTAGKHWNQRHSQAALDIKAHIESFVRRAEGTSKEELSQAISTLHNCNPHFRVLKVNTRPPRVISALITASHASHSAPALETPVTQHNQESPTQDVLSDGRLIPTSALNADAMQNAPG